MKIGMIGDTHLGRKIRRFDLTPFIRSTLYAFFLFCRSQKITHAVHLGDLFDFSSPELRHEKLALQWCNEFERARLPLYLLVGNHDAISGKKTALSALDVIKAAGYRYVRVVDRPLWVEPFLFLPFPVPSLYEKEEDWLPDVEAAVSSSPTLVFSHLNVHGAKLAGQDWVFRGGDFHLPANMLKRENVEKVFNGHIHRAQSLPPKVRCVGAAERLRFSERGNELAFFTYEEGKTVRHPYTGLLMEEIVMDSSMWAEEADPTTSILSEKLERFDVAGKFVKLRPIVDQRSTIEWSEIEKAIYQRGALHVVLEATQQVKEDTRIVIPTETLRGEPLKVAVAYIRQKLQYQSAEERKAVYLAFKRVHQEVVHETGREVQKTPRPRKKVQRKV